MLDEAILRVVLPDLDEVAAPKRWQDIQQRSFVSAVDEQRIVVHPVLRGLLLRQLPPTADPKGLFMETHGRLKDYFTQRAASGEDEAGIEAAYHALALGDADPAIRLLSILAQQISRVRLRVPQLKSWPFSAGILVIRLLEAVRQFPTDWLPEDSKEAHVWDAATAVVLYTWLLSTAHDNHEGIARLQPRLALAYSHLPTATGDRATIMQQRAREAFPADWARTQSRLGNAFAELPGGGRKANLRQAIGYYEAALEVYTPDAFPLEWARTQDNLGKIYLILPGEDRQANLQRAITCFEAALQIYTPDGGVDEYGTLLSNLDAAHRDWRGYGRMNAARELGWTAVGRWGRGGWDLGSWPHEVLYHRDGLEGFDLARDIDGDVVTRSFPSRELRDAATDELVFEYWKREGRSWVEGVESVEQMPAELRGPYIPPSAGEHIKGVE